MITDTRDTRDTRAAGWAGITAFLTGGAVFLLTGTPGQPYPSWSWTDQHIADHFAVQKLNVALQFFLANIGFVLLVWLAAGVRRALLTHGKSSPYTTMIIPCAAAVSLTLIQTNAMWWTAALRGLPPATARIAYEIAISVGYNGTFCFGTFLLLCTGTAMLRSTAFPHWLATTTRWLAAPVAAGDFFLLAKDGPLAPTTIWSLGPYLMLYTWLLVMGVALLRTTVPRTRPEPYRTAPTP